MSHTASRPCTTYRLGWRTPAVCVFGPAQRARGTPPLAVYSPPDMVGRAPKACDVLVPDTVPCNRECDPRWSNDTNRSSGNAGMRYRRPWIPGGSYFFTVVTYRRRAVLCDAGIRALLGAAIRGTRERRPFRMEAITLLPDHLHCVWTLPPDDADFATRWSLIKRAVTAGAQRGRIWQPRFWEHCIRDEADFRNHLDYVHYNPVRHGLVACPAAWPWSSFHRLVRAGVYPPYWGEQVPSLPPHVGRE